LAGTITSGQTSWDGFISTEELRDNVELSGGAGNDDGSPEGTPRPND